MNEHDDLTVNGRPMPGDAEIGVNPTAETTRPSPEAMPPTATPGDTTIRPSAMPAPATHPPARPAAPRGTVPSASDLIDEDTVETSRSVTSGPAITTPEGAAPTTPKKRPSESLPEQLRDRAMDKAHDVSASMGTTAGQLLGQAMELGSAAEQSARALGELVQRQASEIVRQAQERLGVPEHRGESLAPADTTRSSDASDRGKSAQVADSARAATKQLREKLPSNLTPIVLVAVSTTLALVATGVAVVLLRHRQRAERVAEQIAEAPRYMETIMIWPGVPGEPEVHDYARWEEVHPQS